MRFLLVCAVLAAVCGVALSDYNMQDEFLKYGKECFEKHDIEASDFETLKEEDFDPTKVKQNLKCAMHCIMHKSGYMDESGKLRPENIKPKIPEDKVPAFEKAFEECKEVVGETACDTTFLIFGCMMEQKDKFE